MSLGKFQQRRVVLQATIRLAAYHEFELCHLIKRKITMKNHSTKTFSIGKIEEIGTKINSKQESEVKHKPLLDALEKISNFKL